MGVHISTVKSLTLDKWQPKWVETVSRIGNRIGNLYYENRLPSNFRRPVHADGVAAVEHFVRAKYERKEFVPQGEASPSERLSRGLAPQDSQPVHLESTLVDEEASQKSYSININQSEGSMGHAQDSFDLLGGLSPIKVTPSNRSGFGFFNPPPQQEPKADPIAMGLKPLASASEHAKSGSPFVGLGDIDPFAVFTNNK